MNSTSSPHLTTFLLLCFYFTSVTLFAQVGIGTTNPSATLHVQGNYQPAVTTTQNLFTENFNSWTVGSTGDNSATTGSCTTTTGWEIRSTTSAPSVPNGRNCSSCTGKMLYASSYDTSTCKMDATAMVDFPVQPDANATAVNISFDYLINAAGERLRVYLYNNTRNSSIEIMNFTGRRNTSFSEVWPIIGGETYSLHFRYTGEWQYYVTVDNIKVTQEVVITPASYAFRMDDGNVQPGAVLTCDAFGNAFWQLPNQGRAALDGNSILNTSNDTPNKNTELLFREMQQAVRKRQAIIEAREEKIRHLEDAVRSLNLKNRE